MASRSEAVSLLRAALDGAASPAAWNHLVESATAAVDLSGLDLRATNLTGLSFRGCNLDASCLDTCRLLGVNLNGASLVRASLKGATLRQATLVRAVARQADFRGAQVAGADFSWCDLRNARLDDLDLSDAVLWKADLRGASFPRFVAQRGNQVISDADDTPEDRLSAVPLPQFLKALGGMIGVPYRWGGGAVFPHVQMPDRVDDPVALMRAILDEFDLVATPTGTSAGEPDYYLVTPGNRGAGTA